MSAARSRARAIPPMSAMTSLMTMDGSIVLSGVSVMLDT